MHAARPQLAATGNMHRCRSIRLLVLTKLLAIGAGRWTGAAAAMPRPRGLPVGVATHHACASNNVSRFGPMACAGPSDQSGHRCCKLNQQNYHCAEDTGCNVCPFCCHASLKDPHACSACVSQHCDENLAKLGCTPGVNTSGCCPHAQHSASATSKNVLLIGDSVTNRGHTRPRAHAPRNVVS